VRRNAFTADQPPNDRKLSDDRILGSGEFVERIIKEAEARIKYQLPSIDHSEKIDEFILKLCKNEKIPIEEIQGGSRRRKASKVRALIAMGLVKKHGVTLAEAARLLGVSTSAISKIIKRASQ
jgi:putative transposase